MPKSENRYNHHPRQLLWPISQIDFQRIMLGFLVEGHICTYMYMLCNIVLLNIPVSCTHINDVCFNKSLSLSTGMNSIIVYVGHEVFEDYFPFSWVGHRDSHLSFLSSNLIGTCMWMIIAYYWYLIGFFVKI